jgi:hypothetical protein
VVSDLLRKRPIWFGGIDRSEESMDLFFKEWGEKKTRKIRLAVMDMWKPFRKSTLKNRFFRELCESACFSSNFLTCHWEGVEGDVQR